MFVVSSTLRREQAPGVRKPVPTGVRRNHATHARQAAPNSSPTAGRGSGGHSLRAGSSGQRASPRTGSCLEVRPARASRALALLISPRRSRRSLVMISSASRLSIAAPSSLRIAAGYREPAVILVRLISSFAAWSAAPLVLAISPPFQLRSPPVSRSHAAMVEPVRRSS